MFDLPVGTREERKAASDFRYTLLDLGFEMAQFSIYVRYFLGKERASAFLRRVQAALPPDGKVEILMFTDKQYENMISFYNRKKQPPHETPEQFLLL